MSLFRRNRCEPMPARFNELADYNARAWKGIQHTPEYTERMVLLQADFNEWNRQQMVAEGWAERAPGVYVRLDEHGREARQ